MVERQNLKIQLHSTIFVKASSDTDIRHHIERTPCHTDSSNQLHQILI